MHQVINHYIQPLSCSVGLNDQCLACCLLPGLASLASEDFALCVCSLSNPLRNIDLNVESWLAFHHFLGMRLLDLVPQLQVEHWGWHRQVIHHN